MALIRPFNAVRYNQDKVKDLSLVVAPPYDVVSPDMQDELYRAHPYNIVRLILGKIKKGDGVLDNRYTRAKRFFESWLRRRIMVMDSSPAIYIYSQRYKARKRTIDRTGFIGLMGLGIGRSGEVLPHENTLAAPKADRLNLMRAVNANLSPIFVLYDDKRHEVMRILRNFCAGNRPIIDIGSGGVRHAVWRMDDAHAIDRLEYLMRDKEVFIADGHHRFETARNYYREVQGRDAPERVKRSSGYTMAYFVESNEAILTVLPAHRLVKDAGSLAKEDILHRLKASFYLEKVKGLNALMSRLAKSSTPHIFGLYLGKGAFYILKLKNLRDSDRVIKERSRDWKRLDVSILHLFIFQHLLGIRDSDDNIEFLKDASRAVDLVDKGRREIAFFLNPTKVSQVKKIARLGEKMPRKATYFYPKPLSGLVINKFGN